MKKRKNDILEYIKYNYPFLLVLIVGSIILILDSKDTFIEYFLIFTIPFSITMLYYFVKINKNKQLLKKKASPFVFLLIISIPLSYYNLEFSHLKPMGVIMAFLIFILIFRR